MLDEFRLKVLKSLRNLRYPYVIERMIRDRLERIAYSKKHHGDESHGHFCYNRLRTYETNIDNLQKIRNKSVKESRFKITFSPEESENEIMNRIREIKKNEENEIPKLQVEVSFPKTDDEIEKLAYEIALYFSQGYEMYKTSIEMDISSSPILEYYAILQIVKAVVLLELDVHPQEFFGAHGLERRKQTNKGSILQAKIKTHGVFAAFLLRTCTFLIKEDGKKYSIIEELYDNWREKF